MQDDQGTCFGVRAGGSTMLEERQNYSLEEMDRHLAPLIERLPQLSSLMFAHDHALVYVLPRANE